MRYSISGKEEFSVYIRGRGVTLFLTDAGKKDVVTTLTKSSNNNSHDMIFRFSLTLPPNHTVSKPLWQVIVPYKGHYGLPSLSPGSAHAHWAFSLWLKQSSVLQLGWQPPRSARLTNPWNTKISKFILFVNNYPWLKHNEQTSDYCTRAKHLVCKWTFSLLKSEWNSLQN